MPTAEAVKCACGLQMEDNGLGAFLCENCDTTQPQETLSLSRRKTKQDIRFDMYWLRVINTEYEDNTKSDSKEDSEENDGGNTNG